MSEVEKLRQEIAVAAWKVRMAYIHDDMATFHFQLGQIVGLASRLYEENAKEEAK